MKPNTWKNIERVLRLSPDNVASSVDDREILESETILGRKLDPDHAEFIRRFGGAYIGIYEIWGLRRAANMGRDFESILDLNAHFRKQKWPGVSDWIVFTIDQGGNPIGIAGDGWIWLSDSDAFQIVAICRSFEEFLRSWCLEIDPQADQYYRELAWPEHY